MDPMRTTLNIDDALMRKIKQRANQERRTITEVIEEALLNYTQPRTKRVQHQWNSQAVDAAPIGGIDFADRDALYRAMDDDGATRKVARKRKS